MVRGRRTRRRGGFGKTLRRIFSNAWNTVRNKIKNLYHRTRHTASTQKKQVEEEDDEFEKNGFNISRWDKQRKNSRPVTPHDDSPIDIDKADDLLFGTKNKRSLLKNQLLEHHLGSMLPYNVDDEKFDFDS